MGGKKAKKRTGGGGNNKGKPKNNNDYKPKKRPDVSAGQKSLYSIYKYCTDAVIEWGRFTYQRSSNSKSNGGKKNSKKNKNDSCFTASTLSQALFDILGSLAYDGVQMPDAVLRDLRTSIAYRRRVGAYYRSVPSASKEDHDRHEWLIVQLEHLERLFAYNSSSSSSSSQGAAADNYGPTTSNTMEATEKGFAALVSLSDDEESEEEEEDPTVLKIKKIRKPLTMAPTAEQLETEQRLFAISLVLCEIAEIRMDLQKVWKDWAVQERHLHQNRTPGDSEEAANTAAAADLLAATSFTEYALGALRNLVLSTSVEFDSFGDFDQILQAFGANDADHDASVIAGAVAPEDYDTNYCFDIDDCVTIRKLESQSDLNGRHGRIVNGPANNDSDAITYIGEHFVYLFPLSGYSSNAATTNLKQIVSIQTDNLLLSDNTFLRLSQVHKAMKTFDFDSVPAMISESSNTTNLNNDMMKACSTMISKFDQFSIAVKNQDFVAFLNLTVQYVMPLWVSFSRVAPFEGATDVVLNAYVKDFDTTREVKFQLAFALMVAIDSAFAVSEFSAQGDSALNSRAVVVMQLNKVCQESTYSSAIQLMARTATSPDGYMTLVKYLEFTHHICREYSFMCRCFPLVAGELLIYGCRMNLICSHGLPRQYHPQYVMILHLYWMLRSESCIGRMPEIEDTLIRMYRQHVWFRGGLPRKGQKAFIKSWQIACGASLEASKLMDGRKMARDNNLQNITSARMSSNGLTVTEISRLFDILQWQSMPFLDRDACLQEIQQVAREECHAVFTAPLMETCVKLLHLIDTMGANLRATAGMSCERMMPGFSENARGMTDIALVCTWGLTLADDRAKESKEKEVGLALLAKAFQKVLVEEPLTDDTPSLTSSPNDHSVDPSLWGAKGLLRAERLIV